MSMRIKILAIVFVTFSVLFTILAITSRAVVLNGFNSLELKSLRTNSERALGEIENSFSRLDSIAGDWAPWDDTYDFVQTRSEEYAKSNLNIGHFCLCTDRTIASFLENP